MEDPPQYDLHPPQAVSATGTNPRPVVLAAPHFESAPMQLTQIEMVALAYYAGFRGSQIDNIVAIAHQESGYNSTAKNVNSDSYHSVDRGLFQINNHWHPDVSDQCAYNPVCSARAAYAISNQGTDFSAWNSNVDGWKTVVPQVKATRENQNWSSLVGQFSANGTIAGRGTHGQVSTGNQGGGTTPPTTDIYYGSLLFHCSSGGVSEGHILSVIPVPSFSLPDIGCYLRDTLEFVGLAVGGLLGIGVGVVLLANSNKTIKGAADTLKKTGVQTAALAAAPVTDGASEGAELTVAQQATAQRHAERQAFNLQREQRIAERQQSDAPFKAARAKASASKERAQGSKTRAEAAEIRERVRRSKNPVSGNNRTVTILGQQVDIPDVFDVNADDPTRMKG